MIVNDKPSSFIDLFKASKWIEFFMEENEKNRNKSVLHGCIVPAIILTVFIYILFKLFIF